MYSGIKLVTHDIGLRLIQQQQKTLLQAHWTLACLKRMGITPMDDWRSKQPT